MERINKILAGAGKVALIIGGFYLLLCLYDCTRDVPKPIYKKGPEKVVKQTHAERIDTVLVHDTLLVKSKPKTVVKWLKDTIDITDSIRHCDYVTVQTDTITKEGVKLAILDTIRNNAVIGRQTQLISANRIITNTIHDSVFSLRVDTVIITKQRKGWLCAACFGAGVVVGSVF
jgi:hypothetical protein